MRESLHALGQRDDRRCWLCAEDVDAAPLFTTLSRLTAGDGGGVAALLLEEADATRARGFAVERASLVLGGCWGAEARRDRDWWSVWVRRTRW